MRAHYYMIHIVFLETQPYLMGELQSHEIIFRNPTYLTEGKDYIS